MIIYFAFMHIINIVLSMQFPILLLDTIRVKVSPGAKKDEYISTLPDGTIKIRLRATPTDGKANI